MVARVGVFDSELFDSGFSGPATRAMPVRQGPVGYPAPEAPGIFDELGLELPGLWPLRADHRRPQVPGGLGSPSSVGGLCLLGPSMHNQEFADGLDEDSFPEFGPLR